MIALSQPDDSAPILPPKVPHASMVALSWCAEYMHTCNPVASVIRFWGRIATSAATRWCIHPPGIALQLEHLFICSRCDADPHRPDRCGGTRVARHSVDFCRYLAHRRRG